MQYVALLRGINVGGKSPVSMAKLKQVLIEDGFTNVTTYINSGNVIFSFDEKEVKIITKHIEKLLEKHFFPIKTIVISNPSLQQVIEQIPKAWKQDDLRKYIAFVKEPIQPADVIKEVQLKQGVDFIEAGPHVVYMSTKMGGLTQSGFPKLITKKIYQNMTMRNFNTVQKLLVLMEEK